MLGKIKILAGVNGDAPMHPRLPAGALTLAFRRL
jgi:hypothetical protein